MGMIAELAEGLPIIGSPKAMEESADNKDMRQRRLLIVDDDDRYQLPLRKVLQTSLGNQVFVETAPSAREAVKIIQNTRAPVDVVLSDISMPDLDGVTFLMNLRWLSPETQVILMTAYDIEDFALAALRAGAVDILQKPLDFGYLVRRVEECLERSPTKSPRRPDLSALEPPELPSVLDETLCPERDS